MQLYYRMKVIYILNADFGVFYGSSQIRKVTNVVEIIKSFRYTHLLFKSRLKASFIILLKKQSSLMDLCK